MGIVVVEGVGDWARNRKYPREYSPRVILQKLRRILADSSGKSFKN